MAFSFGAGDAASHHNKPLGIPSGGTSARDAVQHHHASDEGPLDGNRPQRADAGVRRRLSKRSRVVVAFAGVWFGATRRGDRGGEFSVLVTGRPFRRILRRGQAEADRRRRWSGPSGGRRKGCRWRSVGPRRHDSVWAWYGRAHLPRPRNRWRAEGRDAARAAWDQVPSAVPSRRSSLPVPHRAHSRSR